MSRIVPASIVGHQSMNCRASVRGEQASERGEQTWLSMSGGASEHDLQSI